MRKQHLTDTPLHFQHQEWNNKQSYEARSPQVQGNSFCLGACWGAANSHWFSGEINAETRETRFQLLKRHSRLLQTSELAPAHAQLGRICTLWNTERCNILQATAAQHIPLLWESYTINSLQESTTQKKISSLWLTLHLGLVQEVVGNRKVSTLRQQESVPTKLHPGSPTIKRQKAVASLGLWALQGESRDQTRFRIESFMRHLAGKFRSAAQKCQTSFIDTLSFTSLSPKQKTASLATNTCTQLTLASFFSGRNTKV